MRGAAYGRPDPYHPRSDAFPCRGVPSAAGRGGKCHLPHGPLLSELQGEWEGEASRAYSARFSELRPGFVKAQELIGEIAQALDATAQSLEEVDANIASQFRG